MADFVEAHTIRARIRSSIVRKFDRTPGNDTGDDLGQVPDSIVMGGLTDVERLIEDDARRCLERGNESARDILDMHNWAPRRPVRFQMDLSRRECPGNKI